jgi:hypothetical protein
MRDACSGLRMTLSPRPIPLVIALAAGSTTSALACGASINVVYEGDVRFEHCMALDDRATSKSAAQKSCWEEWGKYYTFGQTRDRVDYARLRQKQLSGDGDGGDGATANRSLALRAVPEPTTVLAPPPMMLADAGRPPEADAAAPDASALDAAELPAAACASQCGDGWASCKKACTTAACEKTCATSYKRCMKKCF